MTDSLLHSELLWVSLRSFLISLFLTPVVRDIFRSYNVMDRPGARKVHVHPTPRVGGIPIAAAYLTALFTLLEPGDAWFHPESMAARILPGAAIIFATGLIDDLLNLQPYFKLGGQVVAALVAFAGGLRIDYLAGIEMPLWLSLGLTVFWLLLTTNALNLIDGLDGLCSGMGLCATLTLFAAALLHSNGQLALTTLPLAAALVGFLCHNFSPATVFLGDSGALLIGYLLGCFGVIWLSGEPPTRLSYLVPILALIVPLADVALSIIRRFLQGRRIFGADRGHIHHRLLDRGMSTPIAVLTLYLCSMVAAVVALVISLPNAGWLGPAALIAFCVIGIGVVHHLGYHEFAGAARFFLAKRMRRAMSSSIQIDELHSSLKAAQTDEQWWAALSLFARANGWIRIEWLRPGLPAKELKIAEELPGWSFRLNLPGQETLIIAGAVADNRAIPELSRFLSAVTETAKPLARTRESTLEPQASVVR